jgi:hypothetical protein
MSPSLRTVDDVDLLAQANSSAERKIRVAAIDNDWSGLRLVRHVRPGIFAKSFFIMKVLCAYTMNNLRQEISLPDHGAAGALSLSI